MILFWSVFSLSPLLLHTGCSCVCLGQHRPASEGYQRSSSKPNRNMICWFVKLSLVVTISCRIFHCVIVSIPTYLIPMPLVESRTFFWYPGRKLACEWCWVCPGIVLCCVASAGFECMECVCSWLTYAKHCECMLYVWYTNTCTPLCRCSVFAIIVRNVETLDCSTRTRLDVTPHCLQCSSLRWVHNASLDGWLFCA